MQAALRAGHPSGAVLQSQAARPMPRNIRGPVLQVPTALARQTRTRQPDQTERGFNLE